MQNENPLMKNLSDEEATRYFETLPKFMQENIMQSGISYASKQELEDIVNKYKSEM